MERFIPVKILVTLSIALITISGLFGVRFTNGRNTKFVISRLYLAYTLLFTLTFAGVYLTQMYSDYTQGRMNLRDAAKLYGYMNIIIAVLNYIVQLTQLKTIVYFINNVPLFDTIRYFQVDAGLLKCSVALAIVRSCAFPLLIEITLILQQLRQQPQLSVYWTLYSLFPILVTSLLNNCFYSAIILAKAIMHTLNLRLKSLAQEINSLQSPLQMALQKPYYRTQRFCDLADLLDKIAKKYMIVCVQTLIYTDLMALSVLFSLVSNLLGITTGFFNLYTAIADTWINEEPYDIYTALTNLIFLIVSIVEISLLAQLCNDLTLEAKTSGYVLQTMCLKNVDIRFEQSVEAFSLLITTIKYEVKLIGLITINVSLLNDVLSAVTSFLLILIQSDLTLRFSLK